MHATLFYEFQRLCLGFFCIFFISMMRLGLQDRRSENILNLVPNHHTPLILSKFTSYKFGLSYLFFFSPDDKDNMDLPTHFLQQVFIEFTLQYVPQMFQAIPISIPCVCI